MSRPLAPALSPAVALLLLAASLPAQALFKVVGPDGSVTYTDRPPATTTNARVTPMGRTTSTPLPAPGPEAGLPFELRQLATRYPVTLYATADCTFCEPARKLLRERGIPYAEKRVASGDDQAALERLVGARTVPSLTVGVQPARGFAPDDWQALLDAAGYPRESRLPRGWQAAAPSPLAARAAPAPMPASAPAAETTAAPPPPAAPAPDAGAPVPAAPPPAPDAPGVRF